MNDNTGKLVITSGTPTAEFVPADGRDVLITGRECQVNLTGHCNEVRVIGEGHRISAEGVETLGIQGSRNEIQVNSLGAAKVRGEDNDLAWSKSAAGSPCPMLNIDGDGNSVSMVA